MRIFKWVIMSAVLLSACSTTGPVEDRRMVNERFYGTVVSVNRTRDVNWQGAGSAVAGSAGQVAARSTNQLGSTLDSRLGAAGAVGAVTRILTMPFSSSSGSVDVSPVDGLTYVIETEEGNRVTVLSSDRYVFYPGHEVMVVRNQRGYSEVMPRNLSERTPGGL